MDRDQELDNILNDVSFASTSEGDIQQWQKVLQSELHKVRQENVSRERKRWVQILAASLLGFLLGYAANFGRPHKTETTHTESAENFSATVEYVYSNR